MSPVHVIISLRLSLVITTESRLALKGQWWQENWPHLHPESVPSKIKALPLWHVWIGDICRGSENNGSHREEEARLEVLKNNVILLCEQKVYTVISRGRWQENEEGRATECQRRWRIWALLWSIYRIHIWTCTLTITSETWTSLLLLFLTLDLRRL